MILGRQTIIPARLGREFNIDNKDGLLCDFFFLEAKMHYMKVKSSHLAMISTGRELMNAEVQVIS